MKDATARGIRIVFEGRPFRWRCAFFPWRRFMTLSPQLGRIGRLFRMIDAWKCSGKMRRAEAWIQNSSSASARSYLAARLAHVRPQARLVPLCRWKDPLPSERRTAHGHRPPLLLFSLGTWNLGLGTHGRFR